MCGVRTFALAKRDKPCGKSWKAKQKAIFENTYIKLFERSTRHEHRRLSMMLG